MEKKKVHFVYRGFREWSQAGEVGAEDCVGSVILIELQRSGSAIRYLKKGLKLKI